VNLKRILIAILFLSQNYIYASHVSGGDISYKCMGNNQYEITLNLFRDCSGITMSTSETVTITSSCGTKTVALSLTNPGGTEISQLCPSFLPQSTCNGGNLPGMQRYTYKGTVSLTPPCSNWVIKWTTCCRNATNNVTNSLNLGIEISAMLNTIQKPCNNSPVFNAQPIPFVCANQQVIYDFGVTESDGDSLAFSLVSAKNDAGNNVTYTNPYSATNPITGITINPNTGQLTFTATQTGFYIVVVQINEYDLNGNLIGTTMRDIQFVVQNCTNSIPPATDGVITNLTGTATQTGNYSVEMCDGGTFTFDISVSDPDTAQIVTLASNITAVLPGATFTTNPGNPATATISWTAPGSSSYFNTFSVFAQDDACPIKGIQTYTYSATILPSTVASKDTAIICGTQNAQISVTGGTSFIWTTISGDPIIVGTNFSCDTCDTVTAIPSVTTLYEVASNLNGTCKNKDTVEVRVVPDFTYTKNQTDSAICMLQATQFFVNPDSAGTHTFKWTPSAYFPNDSVFNPVANINQSGNQTVFFNITSPDGCLKTDSFKIVVSPSVQPYIASILADTTVCVGASTTMTSVMGVAAGSPCNYTLNMFDSFGDGWNGGKLNVFINGVQYGSFSATGTGSTVSIPVTQGDSIKLTYTSGSFETENSYQLLNGAGTVVFQNGPPPTVGTVYNALVQCVPSTATYTYAWTPTIWLSDSVSSSTTTSPGNDTTYTLIVTDSIGKCSDTASINIYVVPDFGLTLTVSDSAVCLQEQVQLSVTPDTAGTFTYQWTPTAMVNIDTIINPTGTLPNPGTTHFVATVTSDWGCTISDSIPVLVSNSVKPIISIKGDTIICLGDNSQLQAISSASGKIFDEDFDPTIDSSLWVSFSGLVNTNCGSVSGKALYFNTASGVVRQATTKNLNVLSGGTVNFSLKIGQGGAPCEQADLGENVVLEYSINNGATWTIINTYQYNAYPNFTALTATIPNPAKTSATRFRWRQLTHSGSGFDNWALDNISIISTGNNYIYSWTPGIWLNDSTIYNPITTPLKDTTYSVYVSDSLNVCRDAASIKIYVVPTFNTTTSVSDSAICLKDSVQLTVVPDTTGFTYTYVWSPSTYISDTTSQTTTASNILTPGINTFYVSVDKNGCTKRDSVKVNVSSGGKPDLTINAPSPICAGQSSQIVVINNGPQAPCNYTINMFDAFGDGWNGASLQFFVNGNLVGTYTLTTGSMGTVTVPVTSGANISINYTSGTFPSEESYMVYDGTGTLVYTANAPPPQGNNVYVGVANCGYPAAGYSVQWTPTTYLNDPTVGNPVSTPPSTITYQVIVTDTLGECSDTTSKTIVVTPLPVPVINATNSPYCSADPAFNLSATINGGTWVGSGTSVTGTFNPSLAGAGTHTVTYNVIVNNCPGSDTATVVVNQTPPKPAVVNNTYCRGILINLEATGTGGTLSWYKDSALTNLIGTGSPVGATASDTSYWVIETSAQGCTGLPSKLTVSTWEVPVALFTSDYSPDNNNVSFTVNFTNTSTSADTNAGFNYVWTLPDGTQTSANTQFEFTEPGSYTIILVTTDSVTGCSDTASYIVVAEQKPEISTFNIFTPNGDGMNDAFVVRAVGLSELVVTIFNRWGNKVEEYTHSGIITARQEIPVWNGGNHKDGTYFYVITAKDHNGDVVNFEQMKGTVTLIKNK
jgi:gliding motility-associated-like protein